MGIGGAKRGRRMAAVLSTGILLVQMVLLAAGFWLALAVRFDFSMLAADGRHWVWAYFFPLLPLVMSIKLAVWLVMGLHRGNWRYVGVGDLIRLIGGSQIALGLIVIGYYVWQRLEGGGGWPTQGMPATVFLLDDLFGVLLVGGARVLARMLHEGSRPIANGGLVRLLIIGAGDAAESVLREIRRMPEQRYRVVGLLDDDVSKAKARLHGAPVLGSISTLPRICHEQQIGEILIALPKASNQEMQRIVSLCRATQMTADMRGGGGGVEAQH